MRLIRLLPAFFAVSVLAAPSISSAAPAATFELCHRTGDGTFQALSVSAKATRAHLAHGDVLQPNGVVPDTSGFVFDSACNVVSWDYAVNAAPHTAAQDPGSPGNIFAGSGVPASNFGTARSTSAGIELGMMVLYRQGPTVPSTDDYADGVLDFEVASGPQSTANGSGSDNAGRAAWNYTFSVATGLDGKTTNLSDFTFQLLYDVDPGPGTTFRTLTLEAEGTAQGAGQSGYQWRDSGTGLVFIADDEGNLNVTQNSQNYGFSFYSTFTSPYGPGNAFSGPAQFDLVLQALDVTGTQIIARNHIVVNVASGPTP